MMEVFSTLGVVCSGLETLGIQNCEHWETLSMLSATAQQSLQQLHVALCESRGRESFPQFPNLRKLHVRYLSGTNVMQSVTSLQRAALALTDFRLSSYHCCPVSDVSLQVLSNHASGLEILDLDLQERGFTPTAVVALAKRCSNLKTLTLMCGAGVDDAPVEAFARHCLRLEALQLWGRFTDASLSAVATHCGS
jgi:hypothetical protein